MPLNATKEEMAAAAARDLALKLKLEPKLERKMNSIFRRINRDLEATIAKTGGTISANSYSRDFAVALDAHYKRVQKEFTGQITDFAEEELQENADAELSLGLAAIASTLGISVAKLLLSMRTATVASLEQFRAEQTPLVTSRLVNTTQKDINKSFQEAERTLRQRVEGFDANGQPLPERERISPERVNEALADEVSENFWRKTKSRASVIAATETQKSAEATKETDRDALSSVTTGPTARRLELDFTPPEERWVSMGDDVVRPAHLEADFQIKQNGTYTVDGEKLRYPSDTSLGASKSNTINCRCSSVVSIK